MPASGAPLAGGDYVVRYGLRGFVGALFGLLVWTGFACLIAASSTAPSIPAGSALAAGEIVLLAGCGLEIRRAAKREVVFAVHLDGVYFGSGPLTEEVPWDLISAVELFTERISSRGIRAKYHCVGVRAPKEITARDLSRPRMQAMRGGDRGAILDDRRTGRPAQSGDGIRLVYRRMRGWRIDRAALADAVGRFAPQVPVIDGSD